MSQGVLVTRATGFIGERGALRDAVAEDLELCRLAATPAGAS